MLITELVRLMLHSTQHPYYRFIIFIHSDKLSIINIMTSVAEFQPALGFRGFLHGIC